MFLRIRWLQLRRRKYDLYEFAVKTIHVRAISINQRPLSVLTIQGLQIDLEFEYFVC